MDSLPPIPTPASQRWREFRIRVLPFFFFVTVAAAVTLLWREVAIPPTLAVGFAETNSATVSVPMDGQISQLVVRRFQQVKQGDPICQVIIKPTNILSAEIDVIKADIEKIRITMAPIVDEERARLAYYQLRLDLMKERGMQANDVVQLRQAKDDFKAAQELLKSNAISTNQFEQARTKMDALQATVDERDKLLVNMTEALNKFTLTEISTNGTSGSMTPIGAAIAVQAARIKQLEATSTPIPLIAPIDGMITGITRHSGEYLRAGEPILAISTAQSEQIIGYVRQPMSIQPKVGMPVQVRARTPKRETASATVTQVGAQMEPFSTAMIPNAPNQRLVEFGLPIQVTLPPALKLMPGELVDLILEPK